MRSERKIKVVFAMNDFTVGGAQRQLARQLKLYDREKFSFYLITLFQFKDRKNFYDLLPDDVVVNKLNFNNFFDFASWVKLFNILKEINPDVVITSLFFTNTILRILKIILGYKVIAREHNTYVKKIKSHIFIDKILSFFTYKIVAVSNGVADFTSRQEFIPREKFIVIHNGIDIDEINEFRNNYRKDQLKKELGFSEADKIIINVGRLTSQKNHELLIKGFKRFVDENSRYKLLILGEGSLFDKLNKLIKEFEIEKNVMLVGLKMDIWKYYIISEFLISTSKIEGLSNAYLEALAFGLPVVATKTAGTDELIVPGVNGFFINGQDIEEVQSALAKISNANLEEMSLSAFKSAEKFNIRQTVNKYEKLFLSSLQS